MDRRQFTLALAGLGMEAIHGNLPSSARIAEAVISDLEKWLTPDESMPPHRQQWFRLTAADALVRIDPISPRRVRQPEFDSLDVDFAGDRTFLGKVGQELKRSRWLVPANERPERLFPSHL